MQSQVGKILAEQMSHLVNSQQSDPQGQINKTLYQSIVTGSDVTH